MGHTASKETNILITGLYDAGKSTLIQTLNAETEWVEQGIERSRAQKKNLILTSFDIGGRDKIRPLARHFYRQVDAVVYVVDSSSLGSCGQSAALRKHLHGLLGEEYLQHLPFLLLANKQDLPAPRTCRPQDLWDLLELSSFDGQRRVEVLPVSLLTGEGVGEVEDWLQRQVSREMLHTALVQPLQKAVPPSLTSAGSKVSSALKNVFGMVRKRSP